MARRGYRKGAGGLGALVLFLVAALLVAIKVAVGFVVDNKVIFIILGGILLAIGISFAVIKTIIDKQRKDLLDEILAFLHLENITQLPEYDDRVVVKSKQSLGKYTDLKYIKDNNAFDKVRTRTVARKEIYRIIDSFLKENNYKTRPQYEYVKGQLIDYMEFADGFRVKVVYITPAGNNRGERIVHITSSRVDDLIEHPELLMTKGEYNKVLKQQAKEELDSTKHYYYDRVNEIIEFANNSKESLIVKSQAKNLDELIQKLFDRTVNSIQKIKSVDSDEWNMIDNFITTTEKQIQMIASDDKRISDYYYSDEFASIKETCKLLTDSQKEFNEYIDEKAQSITKLFGTRVVRNETQNEDVYNYIRTYKKSIEPFTAEVSASVFSSAENNPIGYIVKYFYPNKSQYKNQIEKLRTLIEELETLKEAKVIIDNYKQEYNQYIKHVPSFVLENDEDGFYSRLGLAIIDEAVLNVEYRFTYTSGGGMAQRSFTIPMNEENITELINQLENRLSIDSHSKEQRALMTTRLRNHIKERDDYTCCQCGNSVYKEPNLLLEIDHIIPISKGGLTQEDNLQTLCWKCNRSKGAKII